MLPATGLAGTAHVVPAVVVKPTCAVLAEDDEEQTVITRTMYAVPATSPVMVRLVPAIPVMVVHVLELDNLCCKV